MIDHLAIDNQSAFEMLILRIAAKAAPADARARASVAGGLGDVLGAIFGTSRPRGQRLSTGQVIARNATRSVTTHVVGGIAADIGRSIGGSMGGTMGRAIARGALSGILRR